VELIASGTYSVLPHRPAATTAPDISLSLERRLPWAVFGLLVALCAVHGFATVYGLIQPADLDSLRDVGSIQGLLDRNWFGDPVYAGEWRWYPPLLPALGAIGVAVTGASPLAFWVQAGPWLNLLTPIAFFLMARELFGSPASAAAATTIYVFLNSTVTLPWVTGGYTPWPLVPSISQAFFFATVGLIRARVNAAMQLRDAGLIGAAIGLTFLAHAVPAVILTAIVTMTTVATLGFRARAIGLLAGVAVLELAVMSPYLAPVLAHYPRGIVNAAPGHYLEGVLTSDFAGQTLLYAPGVVCAAGAWLLRRRAPLSRAALVILVTWVGVASIFLVRQLACGGSGSAACRTFAMPAHHYCLYLQTAWACLAGHVVWQAVRPWVKTEGQLSRRRTVAAFGISAVLGGVGAGFLFLNTYDDSARSWALQDGGFFDRSAYSWIRANTKPTDLFVTPLRSVAHDADAFSVIAAGRRLIAAPELHSNPFVDWRERDALRRRYFAAATGAGPERDLCGLTGLRAWLLVPNTTDVASAAEPMYRTDYNTVYRITGIGCENPA
jgi:hypothetical protein